ncbi:hypothetical protein Ahy_B01g055327 [Arachis hypogaea]|uniref:FAR1 domain-containing protein n=1 Tax=Arachis hypogaea TaxID=3818 RepID=A0A445AVX8_ARAHY|nr:hypothetical protein Ahy_B01g055327 [Arachis hypogaea]
MDDSTSDCAEPESEVDFEFESNEVSEFMIVELNNVANLACEICYLLFELNFFYNVDEQFVSKVGMTFNILEDAAKFYKDYSKAAGFSTRVRSINKKENEIKNQLITCSKEEKWKSKISLTEKKNPSTGLNCPTRIYIHILKDIGI